MSRARVFIAIPVLVLIGTGIAAFTYLRSAGAPAEFQGWVEADIVFVSPDEIGRVATLSVREGSTVEVRSPLFTLDDDLQQAAVAENVAAVTNAKQSYDRAQALLKSAVGSQKTFDDAEAALRSAEARLNSTKTRLDRRRMLSPVAGMVQEVYFRVGEMVEPGRPILSIVPPGNVKVRFFVPQASLPSIHIGDRVLIHCDGCGEDLMARVSFISAQAEFTPPVIYSLEERARLVFRIEAIPERPGDLRIGQPASVALQSAPIRGTVHAEK
jgi:HlyD family secretion protein